MAHTSGEITDNTPLDGDRVDVAARIGWLLRVNRLGGGLTLRGMSRRLKELGLERCSSPVLLRMELNGQRRVRLIEGYEEALELPPGTLSSAVQTLCQTFPHASPEEDRPEIPATLEVLDATVEPLLEAVEQGRPRSIRGGDWMTFSRVTRATDLIVPSRLARPVLQALVAQLSMSVDAAYRMRSIALQDLLSSEYRDLLVSLIKEYVDTPGCAVMNDLVSGVGEVMLPEDFDWILEMFVGADEYRGRAARLAIEGLAATDWVTRDHWVRVIEAIVGLYLDPATPRSRRDGVARLIATLPAGVRRVIRHRIGGEVRAALAPASWQPERRHNRHLAFAHQLARLACDDAGVDEQPMAERLIFEMIFDPRTMRNFSSTMLLGSSPLAPALVRACIELGIHDPPDEATYIGCVEAMVGLPAGWHPGELDRLIPSAPVELQRRLLISAGHCRTTLDPALVRRLVDDRRTERDALYYLGFVGHPMLDQLADDPDPRLARSAGWWRDQAPGVLD